MQMFFSDIVSNPLNIIVQVHLQPLLRICREEGEGEMEGKAFEVDNVEPEIWLRKPE